MMHAIMWIHSPKTNTAIVYDRYNRMKQLYLEIQLLQAQSNKREALAKIVLIWQEFGFM